MRQYHYEKEENALKRKTQAVYELAAYHDVFTRCDEYMGFNGRPESSVYHVYVYPDLSGDCVRIVFL